MPSRFWVLLGVSLSAAFSSTMLPTALAFILVDLRFPAAALGYVMAAQMLGIGLASTISGALPLRAQPRTIMAVAFLAAAVFQSLTGVLVGRGSDWLWAVVATQAAVGLATGCVTPSTRVLVVEIVPQGLLRRANGLLQGIGTACGIAGPAAAGIILVTGGREVFFWLSATGLALAMAGALALPTVPRTPSQGRSFLGDVAAGYQYVLTARLVRALFVHLAVVTVVLAVVFVLGPLAATTRPNGEAQWSAVMVAVAVGGLAGSLLLSLRREDASEGASRVAQIRLWTLGLVAVPYLVVGRNTWIAVAVAAVAGLAVAVVNVLVTTELQARVSREHIGSVFAVERLLTVVLRVVPYTGVAVLAGYSSAWVALACGAIVVLTVAVGPLRSHQGARLGGHDAGKGASQTRV